MQTDGDIWVTLTAVANVVPNENLLITAVFDGPLPGGLPKGIELYVINDINDLSEYGVATGSNLLNNSANNGWWYG